MRKFLVMTAALAGALLAAPALADPSLAGTTWADDDCMVAYEFHSDYTFLEYDVMDDEYTGRWQVSSGTLYLSYDDGWNVQTAISDSMFTLTYGEGNDSYTCYFVPD